MLRRCIVCAVVQSWEALVRIVTSPTPFLYRHLLATLVFIFVFTFPLGFVHTLGPVVIPASIFMCFGLYVRGCSAGGVCVERGEMHA